MMHVVSASQAPTDPTNLSFVHHALQAASAPFLELRNARNVHLEHMTRPILFLCVFRAILVASQTRQVLLNARCAYLEALAIPVV